MTSNISLRLKIGLFLFSKGNEVYEFGADQIEQTRQFAIDRYEEGKAFLEKLIADYEGSGFASGSSTPSVLIAASAGALNNSSDAFDRCYELGHRTSTPASLFFASIVEAIQSDPASVRDIISLYNPSSVDGSVAACGIPDDFAEGKTVTLDGGNRPYHEPTEAERTELEELSGAGIHEHMFVLDSGTTPGHDYLREHEYTLSAVPGENGIDRNFHGTHVEGTAAGTKEISTNYRSKVSSIQVFDRRGSGLMSWLASALRTARKKGATVINYSGGASGTLFVDPEVELELQMCDQAGIIVCIAAGNDGWRQGQDTANSPGRSEYASCIGAVGAGGRLTSFGSGGPSVDSSHYGQDVVSANFRGGLSTSNGTSMATPNDADDAANVQSFLQRNGFARLNGTRAWNAFKKEHAEDLNTPGHDGPTGYGILRVLKTLKEMAPDDVQMLASRCNKAVQAACLLIACCLLLPFENASAQEHTVDKVTQVVETTDVVYGTKILSTDSNVLSESIATLPAQAIEVSVDEVTLIDQDFRRRTVKAVDGVVLITDPGKYLVFNKQPSYQQIIVDEIEPEFDLSTIAPMAKALADAMADDPTRMQLATGYESMVYTLSDSKIVFADAGEMVKRAVLEVWPRRQGQSAFKDWVNGFQRPLEEEFDRVGFDTTASYRDALIETIKGLRQGFEMRTYQKCNGDACIRTEYWVRP